MSTKNAGRFHALPQCRPLNFTLSFHPRGPRALHRQGAHVNVLLDVDKRRDERPLRFSLIKLGIIPGGCGNEHMYGVSTRQACSDVHCVLDAEFPLRR